MPASNALVKTRASCDRCHSQKLRCEKAQGLPKCRRCIRLGSLCRYSPRNARRQTKAPFAIPAFSNPKFLVESPRMLESSRAGQCLGAEPRTPIATSALCHVGPLEYSVGLWDLPREGHWDDFAFSDALFDNGLPQNIPEIWPSWSSSNDRQGVQASLHLDEKFNRISLGMRECASPLLLPRMPGSSTGQESGLAAEEKRKSLTLVLDDVFALTKDFVDALDTVASFSVTYAPSVDTLCPHPFSADVSSQALLAENGSMLSCYIWLEKVHTAILRMMRDCVEHSASPRLERGVTIALPKIEIGGVAVPGVHVGLREHVPSRMTTSLYMNTISAVMSELWTRMAGAISRLEVAADRASSPTPGSPWMAMSGGTTRLVVDVTDLRSFM